MKKILLSLVCALGMNVGALVASTSAETVQSRWVADVPIMPDMVIEQGLGFAFDNPDGRIVTIYRSGDVSEANVRSYYAQALEPLGWTQISSKRWKREQEIHQVSTTSAAGVSLWKITLRPE